MGGFSFLGLDCGLPVVYCCSMYTCSGSCIQSGAMELDCYIGKKTSGENDGGRGEILSEVGGKEK